MKINEIILDQSLSVFERLILPETVHKTEIEYKCLRDISDDFTTPAHKILSNDDIYDLLNSMSIMLYEISTLSQELPQTRKLIVEIQQYLDPA